MQVGREASASLVEGNLSEILTVRGGGSRQEGWLESLFDVSW